MLFLTHDNFTLADLRTYALNFTRLLLSRDSCFNDRSAATLAVECGEIHTAERLIAIALSGNPPTEIAEELKDLFVQINIDKYFARRGLAFDEAKLQSFMG